MSATSSPVRRTRWGVRLVVAAVLAATVVTVGATPPSGALSPDDCSRAEGPLDLRPEVRDDGGSFLDGTVITWRINTSWNTPLSVDAPGVLANDSMPGVTNPQARLKAVMWRQTTHGTVTLHGDGSWIYTPSIEHPLEGVTETFEYIAFDPISTFCSPTPAKVTFRVEGYKESVDRAPTAYDDELPADGATVAANEVLQVPAPGVLANDYNNASYPYTAAHNLVAGILTQPVWEGTNTPAGTVTDWGKQVLNGTTVFNGSGGFTYTAPPTGFGVATFDYWSCYDIRPTAANPCSNRAKVRINVGRTAVARPYTVFTQTRTNGQRAAGISVPDLDAYVTFNGPKRVLFPRFGTPAHGTLTPTYWTGPTIGSLQDGDFMGADYVAGPTFSGTDSFTYRMCDTKTDTPTTVCTNDATITVQASAPAPKVESVTLPATPTDPIVVRFDQQVRGVTPTNIQVKLLNSRDVSFTWIPIEIRCTSRALPGTSNTCNSTIDTVYATAVSGAFPTGYYDLRVNRDDLVGIVGNNEQSLPVQPYNQGFEVRAPDTVAPKASPTEATKDGVVTVTWNWTDHLGTGIDPNRCDATTASVGSEPQTLRASCWDLAGNVGTATRDVTPPVPVDEEAPTATPTIAPAPVGGWNRTAATVAWNWTDRGGSGLDPVLCETTSTSSGEGIQLLTARCRDRAGNLGVASHQLKVDTRAPSAAPTVSGAPNGGWNKADVTITWNWSDGDDGSGLDPARCPATSTVSAEGLSLAGAACTDAAGNIGNAPSQAVRIDRAGPTLAPAITPSPLLPGARATAAPGATDTGSGVASSSCGSVDTRALGTKAVTCTATDAAGNASTVAAPYTVGVGVRWLIKPGSIRAKSRLPIAVAVQLVGADGKPIPTSVARTLAPCAVKVALGTQKAACAAFLQTSGLFGAVILPASYPLVGAQIPFVTTVTSGAATLGTASATITVTR